MATASAMAASLAPRRGEERGRDVRRSVGERAGRGRVDGPCPAIAASQSTASAGKQRRRGGAEVQGEADPLPRQQRGEAAAAQRGEVRRRAEEAGEPVVAVEGEDEAAVGEVEGAGREPVARPRPRGAAEARRRGCARGSAGAGRVGGVGLLGAERPVERRLGHASTGPRRRATRARSSGTSSASNQGLRRSQAVLRQDGCGSGRTPGRQLSPGADGFGRPSRRRARGASAGRGRR